MLIPTHTPWRETVAPLTCPLLLLMGDSLRGALVTDEEAQQIAASWRQDRHVSFAHASHQMHHEMRGQPFDALIREVTAFLLLRRSE